MWTLWQDLRYSVRLLARHPGFTLTAVGVLTLGIGVNAGIFGIINGLMLRPLAGAMRPANVVGLYSKDRTTERGYRAFSYAGLRRRRDARTARSRISPRTTLRSAGVTEGTTTRQTFVDVISTGYFDALGVRPIHGRDFTLEEERPGTPARPVIVSYTLWERRAFDPDVLKQTVRINGQDYGVVGVAPPNFGGTTAMIATEFFLPLGVHDAIESDFDSRDNFPLADRRNRSLILIGRLKPEITREQADQQLKVIAAAHEAAFPAENKNQDLVVSPLSRGASAPAQQYAATKQQAICGLVLMLNRLSGRARRSWFLFSAG